MVKTKSGNDDQGAGVNLQCRAQVENEADEIAASISKLLVLPNDKEQLRSSNYAAPVDIFSSKSFYPDREIKDFGTKHVIQS